MSETLYDAHGKPTGPTRAQWLAGHQYRIYTNKEETLTQLEVFAAMTFTGVGLRITVDTDRFGRPTTCEGLVMYTYGKNNDDDVEPLIAYAVELGAIVNRNTGHTDLSAGIAKGKSQMYRTKDQYFWGGDKGIGAPTDE